MLWHGRPQDPDIRHAESRITSRRAVRTSRLARRDSLGFWWRRQGSVQRWMDSYLRCVLRPVLFRHAKMKESDRLLSCSGRLPGITVRPHVPTSHLPSIFPQSTKSEYKRKQPFIPVPTSYSLPRTVHSQPDTSCRGLPGQSVECRGGSQQSGIFRPGRLDRLCQWTENEYATSLDDVRRMSCNEQLAEAPRANDVTIPSYNVDIH